MAVKSTERVRELFYSYAQATRNWRTGSGTRSWPAGLFELGVLLGEGLHNTTKNRPKDAPLATDPNADLFRLWVIATHELLEEVKNSAIKAKNPTAASSPRDQVNLEALFVLLSQEWSGPEAGSKPEPWQNRIQRQLVSADDAGWP